LREKWPVFRELWDSCLAEGFEALEGEMMRRARDGVLEPVYQKGELVGHVRKYSDVLAIVLAKAHAPEKYAEQHRHKVETAAVHYHVHGVRDGTQTSPLPLITPEPEGTVK
jgi:hypothetical protein